MKKTILLPLLCLGLFSCGGSNTPLEPEITHKINFDGGEYLSIDVTECKDQTELFMKISVKDEYLINYEVPQSVAYYEITCNDKEIENFHILTTSDQNYDWVYLYIPKEEVIGDINIKTEGYCHYLTFTGVDDNAPIYYIYHLSAPDPVPQIEYTESLNNPNWQTWSEGNTNKINLEQGKTIYVRNQINSLSNTNREFEFQIENKIATGGNVMSLLNFSPLYAHCFRWLFGTNCSGLISAPILPSTNLADNCYEFMFYGTGISECPILPATTLKDYCYYSMFQDCKAIFKAPKLPAKEPEKGCYRSMFIVCENLVVPPALHFQTLKEECCYLMFSNCKNLYVNNERAGIKFFECPDDISPNNCVSLMFNNTGGISWEGTPTPNTAYYYTINN